MKKFFQAESVAVVGVSNSESNLGRLIALNLVEFRYQGMIHLVGPKGGSLVGHKIHRSLKHVTDPVDLAVILVPASAVPGILRDCGEKGIKRVVVESGGFRELGDDRLGLEKEIIEILKTYGIRMIGPNCLGIINRATGLAVPFMPLEPRVPLGRIAVMAQSGGVGAMMINSLEAENLGICRFASIGNKLDVNEADLVEFLVQDDETDIIFCYLEGITDGRRLMEAAAASDKPIVVHKSNNGKSGSAIAQSHSASLASDDRAVDAALRQCGIKRVREEREALETIKAYSLPRMQGNGLAVLSRSGGHAVMGADAAEEFGFRLPSFPKEMIDYVERESRAKVIHFQNPLDLGDLFNIPAYGVLADMALAREDIHGALFIFNYQASFFADQSRRMLMELGETSLRRGKPIAVCIFTSKSELDFVRKSVSIPVFTDPRAAVRALALNRDRGKNRPLPFAKRRPGGIDRDLAKVVLKGVSPGRVDPGALATVLSAYGIMPVAWEKAKNEEDAAAAALRLGYPVAIKTAEPSVLHKSDAGGVYLDVGDEESLRKAYRNLAELGPSVLVQEMAPAGMEWLVGGRRDETFGPLVVVGLGGIYVEVFKETGIRIGPLGYEEAGRLVGECKGSALLGGVRGTAPLDRESLVDLIVRVSWLLNDFPGLRELDLNPVRVYGRGCRVLDWRATMREAK